MKRFLLFLFLNFVAALYSRAQNGLDMNHVQKQTDTLSAAQLASMEPDSNIVSFKIDIITEKGFHTTTTISGNWIPDNVSAKIGELKPGAIVLYYEITATSKKTLVKLPARKYVIGQTK